MKAGADQQKEELIGPTREEPAIQNRPYSHVRFMPAAVRSQVRKARQGARVLVICGVAMSGSKMTVDEAAARGGKSRSPLKMAASARNLAKAKEVLNAKRLAKAAGRSVSA